MEEIFSVLLEDNFFRVLLDNDIGVSEVDNLDLNVWEFCWCCVGIGKWICICMGVNVE